MNARIIGVTLVAFVVGAICMVMPAQADRMTSTNYTLNGNADGSFGGTSGSTN